MAEDGPKVTKHALSLEKASCKLNTEQCFPFASENFHTSPVEIVKWR